MSIENPKVYDYSKYNLNLILNSINFEDYIIKSGKKRHYNLPCAFDTETSSVHVGYDNTDKFAFVYMWAFGILDYVIIGRNITDFIELHNELAEKLDLLNINLICYVHNLQFDFQFIRKHFKFSKVFLMSSYDVVSATVENGITFKCSYHLTGVNLDTIGKNLQKHNVKKLVGDLDYRQIRTPKTPINNVERSYMINDITVLLAHIDEQIEIEGSINKIPLTKTSYVRRDVRNKCINQENKKARYYYRNMINHLTIEPDEYLLLRRAFMGGFTHANAIHSGKMLDKVSSIDFTSAYPYCMMLPLYPMGKGRKVSVTTSEEFDYYTKNFCCVFDLRLKNIKSTFLYDHAISFSHCRNIGEHYQLDNGRIVWADSIDITITELDYMLYKNIYSWDSKAVSNFYIYPRGYLPSEIILSVLEYYKKKTTLKGVNGMEVEYMSGKANLNSIFGMMVTDIIRDDIEYIEHDESEPYHTVEADLIEKLNKYNYGYGRFTFYPWGIYITSINRYNLWLGIQEFKDDYVYSDTDSIKGLNYEKHEKWVNKYNNHVIKNLQKTADFLGISMDEFSPIDIKGNKHTLGLWDFEHTYTHFKTLGAKRYMCDINGDYEITVAGLNKLKGCDFIVNSAKEKGVTPYDIFKDGLHVDGENTGKLTHTYINTPIESDITDYLGNTEHVKSLSGVFLEPCEYELKISPDYTKFIFNMFMDYLERETVNES